MRLPGLDVALIERGKIVDYLLSTTHPLGRHKAVFFLGHGLSVESWAVLFDSLLELAGRHEISGETAGGFGRKFLIDGSLRTPGGRSPLVRTVCIIEHGKGFPRFVTAYPIPR